MKNSLLTVLLLMLTSLVFAQDEEIKTLVSGQHSHGGFGALQMQYGQFEETDLMMVGIRGGWVIDHAISIGLGGYGIIPDVRLNGKLEDEETYMYGGYGGLYIEPTIAPRFPVHVSFPILFGAGSITYFDNSWNDPWYNDPVFGETYDVFFVVEPAAQIEINLVKFFRLSAGISYRYAHDLTLINTNATAFNSWNGNITMKFGKF